MTNWFNKLLKRNTTPKPLDIEQLTTQQTSHAGLHCTPPIGQKKTPQALEVLAAFSPLNELDPSILSQLPHKTLRYKAGSVVFVQGFQADAIYYLLSGTLKLHPDTDHNFDLNSSNKQAFTSYDIIADTALSLLPLNNRRIFGATAVALTNVDILTVDLGLFGLCAKTSQTKTHNLELNHLNLPEELRNTLFYKSFIKSYREQHLQLPSLPNVALKLKTAMQQDISIREAVTIIQIDPVMVIKLIQVANSPLYAPVSPINNCQDAVTRLGLSVTRNLVMSISLKQLFQCNDNQMMTHMQAVWKQSLYVSSLCFVLAEEMRGINPEEALLAGLINDIGMIPLLHFAGQNPEQFPGTEAFLQIASYLRGPLGRLVLQTLGFSEELTAIPLKSENWLYDSGDELHLIDIVILAKLHSYFGTEKAKRLPFINTIPAYSKLTNGKLNPDLSLTLLHKAQQRINATMNLFS